MGRCRGIELPDAAFFLCIPAGDPVGEIKTSSRTEIHTRNGYSLQDKLIRFQLKRSPLRFEIKSVDSRYRWRSLKFRVDELDVPLIAQGCPGIICPISCAVV